MSKLIAFTYSFLILIQSFNIGLEDLSKLNALLDHAEYHKVMYGDNFYQFLAEHYGDAKDNHENEHEEHKGLPFKDAQHICSHFSTPFINPNIVFNFTYQEFIEIPFNFYYEETFTDFEKSSVFQPPKQA